MLADLSAGGATLVSLNPLRDTLEDFFVQQVTAPEVQGHDRGLGEPGIERAIGLIALNVFRESVRDKVLYNLVVFALLLIGASYLIGQLTAGQDVKIIKDLGLAATSIFGLFIAIFIGIGLVSKEVERRSIYSLLAKPITRTQLVLGKYAGLVLTLAVNLAVMAAALYAVLAFMALDGRSLRGQRLGTAGARSAAAAGVCPDLRRAVTGHRHRAVLLDLLDADALGGLHLRPVRRRPLQRRPAQLQPGRRFGAARGRSPRRSTGCCRTWRRSTYGAGRARPAGHCRLHDADHGLRAALHRRAAGAAALVFSRRDFK